MKKLIIAFIYLLLVVPCIAENTPNNHNNSDYVGSQSAQGLAGSKPIRYVPNQIIVKFHRNIANTIETRLAKGETVEKIGLSNSLDKLHKKYIVTETKPVFKNFKKQRHRIKALLKKDKTFLTKSEKRILRRLRRAPKGAKVPELGRTYKIKVELEPGQSLEKVVAAYNNDPDVEYAELNYIVSIYAEPNDPRYSIQWPLNNTGQQYPPDNHSGTPDCDIDAPEAWDIYTGNSEVVVAVVDTGVDYNHRDLQGNMWTDSNGYYGYDFFNDDNDPMDDHGHGTHCAGIIAADGNNGVDIAGVCWNTRIMALKFLGAGGYGNTFDAVDAFYYAVGNGADVISNSWGSTGYSQSMRDAIDYAHSQGVIMVAAAGNDDSSSPHYPAYYFHVISVASTDSNDRKASFSNYGDWVDIAAPGVDVLSLRANGTSMATPHDDYTTVASGTSMSCSHVSGACALLLSFNPFLTCDEIYDTLIDTVAPISPDICLSGRLNLFNAILATYGLNLSKDYYSCSDEINICLVDSDFGGQGSHSITMTTNGGDSETVLLSEMTPFVGIFMGAILTTSGDPNTEDGTLQVSHGEIITAIYENGSDTATVDCEPPVIFNVNFDECPVGPEPTVTFETNEPTTARILCSLVCGDPYLIEGSDLRLATSHTIKLRGVSPETDYFFIIDANDIVGNKAVDNNYGQCYAFTTDSGPRDVNVPGEYVTIQEAIDKSWNGGTVWIAEGTYTGQGNCDIDFKGKAIIVRSTDPCNPDVVAATIIDCNGTEEEPHRGFKFYSGEGPNSIIAGLTIRNGYAPVEIEYGYPIGGAIYCSGSNPTITRCTITNNVAFGGIGNAISCLESNPTISYCTILNNTCDYLGAGGGIYCYRSSPLISHCIIKDNLHYNFGGGIFCQENSNPIITHCTITGNGVFEYGGGICCLENSSPTISYCTISDNECPYHGGGIYCMENSSPTITNCTIKGNYTDYGGGIYCESFSSPMITYSTIVDNLADSFYSGYGGGICSTNGSIPMISNCILWGNISNNGSQISLPYFWYDEFPSHLTISYSDVEGGQAGAYVDPCCTLDWGEGNIDLDPLLTPDSHLCSGSPCINAGDPASNPDPGETDIDGEPRKYAGRVDIGIDEFIDTDSDGLPDWWEQKYFGDLIAGNPGSDPDGDGRDNLTEYNLNTNPLFPPTYYVDPTAGNDFWDGLVQLWDGTHGPKASIRAAIESASVNEESMIILAVGTYTGIRNRGLDFGYGLPGDQTRTLTIRSTDPCNPSVVAETIIDCQGGDRGFYICRDEGPESVIAGLTITNGSEAGGGISCDGSSPTISHCTITNCMSGAGGGGVGCWRGTPNINYCTIMDNSAEIGGGIYCYQSSPAIRHCIIIGNSASEDGGGIYCKSNSNPMISNCTLAANSSESHGGGLYCHSNSSPTIISCILWGDSPEEIYISSGTPVVNYCDVDGGVSGIDNINTNPRFADTSSSEPNEWDYHLKSHAGRWDAANELWVSDDINSPCIDAGDPNSDWTAELWPHGKWINMGAYGGTPQASMSLSDAGNVANLNNDDSVNYVDLKLFTDKWLYQKVLLPEDLDRNGFVNSKDFAIFANNWLWEE